MSQQEVEVRVQSDNPEDTIVFTATSTDRETLFCPDCGNKSAVDIGSESAICNTTVKYRCSCGCEFFRDY